MRDKQPERTSLLSIWTLACVAAAMLATSLWIALGPVEEFTLRAALGAAMGGYAGLMTGLHAVGRIMRRLDEDRALRYPVPAGLEQAVEFDDEADSDARG